MKYFLHIISALVFFTLTLDAQVVDTSRAINTWVLTHNYTRFEETPVDTNMHQVHRDYDPAFKQGFCYESLGILGHGLNHMDFEKRPYGSEFLFGRAWDPYMKRPDRTIFFNTRTPFTSLAYYTMPILEWKEDNIDVLHTQNASPFTNFGLEFNIITGNELYTNQDTRSNRVGLFGSHAKDRYSIFGTFYYNDYQARENGGLYDQDNFLAGTEDEWWLYDVNLTEAVSHYRSLSLFVTHKYNLFEKKITTDSTGVKHSSGKTLSLSHQLMVEGQFKDYYDLVDLDALSPVYSNYNYMYEEARDSAREDGITNVLQVIVGDPDKDLISARIYASYLFRSFGMLSPVAMEDSVIQVFSREKFNDLNVGFTLEGPTTGTWDWVIAGNYALAGYNAYDFRLSTTFSRQVAQDYKLGLQGAFERVSPHYFTNYYSSSFFQWDQDLTPMLKLSGEAFMKGFMPETDLRAGASLISNYVYWDQEAIPRLYDKEILLISGSFERHFVLAGLNADLRLLLQYTTAKDVLPLPLVAAYTSTYWKQSLFKGALIADLGFDFSISSRYYGSAYMPATSQFHLQDEYLLGGYPFLDVFLAFRVQRTRIFVSYNNVLQNLRFTENNFFTAYRYPLKPSYFRVGLVWTFYD